jgi:hypothetical protein
MGYVRTDDEIQNVLDQRVMYQRDRRGRMRPTIDPGDTIDRGATVELIAAAVGIAAAIIGILGIAPLALAATATIAVSFALLAQGTTIAARWQRASHIPGTERSEAVGIGTEVFGGLAGVTLGVLALVDVAPYQLLPAASIALGSALLLGGPAQPEIEGGRVSRRAARTSGGVMVMAGVAAIALGVLPFLAGGPVFLLASVSMLCTGAALVLAGDFLGKRLAARFA